MRTPTATAGGERRAGRGAAGPAGEERMIRC